VEITRNRWKANKRYLKIGDKKMALDTQASDWEFAGLAEMGAAAGLGGGGYMFTFRSVAASISARVTFLGGGLGLGEAVGVNLPFPGAAGGVPFSAISCANSFSLADLNMSSGSLLSVGVSALVGIGAMSVSAMNISTGVLFENAGGFGASFGSVTIGATAFVGLWRVGSIIG
jgi:hypothetical protein